MITVYHYKACSTCRRAIQWLLDHEIEVKLVDIVTSPPSQAQLTKALKMTGLPVSKLFNTSGQIYREKGYREKLKSLSEKEALSHLAAEGKLIKRPFVLGDGVALVGFRVEEYEAAFSS